MTHFTDEDQGNPPIEQPSHTDTESYSVSLLTNVSH